MDWMEKLLSLVDLCHPALAEAKARRDAGDLAGCADALVAHFRTRTAPRYLFGIEDLRWNTDAHLIEDAEEVMRDTLYGYTFPDGVDWHFNPTTDAAHDNEWS